MKLVLAAFLLVVASLAVLVELDRRDNQYHQQQYSALRVQNELLKDSVAKLAIEGSRKDTVWRVAKARVDTLRDSIPVWQHDTTYIREYVTRTDDALQACTELANSCEQFRRTATTLIASQKVELDLSYSLNVALQTKARRAQYIVPVAFILGGVLGAWVRGQ